MVKMRSVGQINTRNHQSHQNRRLGLTSRVRVAVIDDQSPSSVVIIDVLYRSLHHPSFVPRWLDDTCAPVHVCGRFGHSQACRGEFQLDDRLVLSFIGHVSTFSALFHRELKARGFMEFG